MENEQRKKILILGAGFAGMRVAQDLGRLGSGNLSITLVDKNDIHLYTPDLYEIANSYNAVIDDECLSALKSTITVEISSLISNRIIRFLQDEVKSIDAKQKKVFLKKEGELAYDTLVVALGSKQNFHNIPGVSQFAYPVKTVKDALVVNCHLDTFFHFLWKQNLKKEVMITIGGGGATGVEFAAEMNHYVDLLCAKYGYLRERVNVQIIQSSDELVGAGRRVSEYTIRRLEKQGIRILLNHTIIKADPDKIHVRLKDGTEKVIHSDVLVWAGGVTVNPVVRESLGNEKCNGSICVNEFMQSTEHENVFAAGDSAYFHDPKTGKTVPRMAQPAWEEGRIVAKNIIAEITGKDKTAYRARNMPLILPLGNKWGIVKIGPLIFKGRIGAMVRRFTDLLYLTRIMPFRQAFKKWRSSRSIFLKND